MASVLICSGVQLGRCEQLPRHCFQRSLSRRKRCRCGLWRCAALSPADVPVLPCDQQRRRLFADLRTGFIKRNVPALEELFVRAAGVTDEAQGGCVDAGVGDCGRPERTRARAQAAEATRHNDFDDRGGGECCACAATQVGEGERR